MVPGIVVAREGLLATVILSNPAKLNAITAGMWQELTRVLSDEQLEEECHAVARRIAEGAPLANRRHKQKGR